VDYPRTKGRKAGSPPQALTKGEEKKEKKENEKQDNTENKNSPERAKYE
jgi:hypothetical protein